MTGMNADIEQWQVGKRAVHDADGMVAAQHHLAARAGADLLARGGNAVDAAVAAALALGAVEPWMCGLGGSGLMVVWLAEQRRAITLDFQGVLSRHVAAEDYPVDAGAPLTLMGFPTVQGEANVAGYRSITVPGAAAGFDHALSRWGTLELAAVAQPAITLAEHGVHSDWFTTLQSALAMGVIERDPTSASIYLPGGQPIAPEQRLLIPGLASTLRRFADTGAEGFYRGALARDLVSDLQNGGSRIDASDLAGYTVQEAEAIQAGHRGAVVHTLGDTSGGTRLRDFLGHVSSALPTPPPAPTPATWGVYAAALDRAWRAHNRRIGRVTEQGSCTSHLSTVDAHGNMVALTHTLLNRFGAGVTLPLSGLLMNNAVSYFDPRSDRPVSLAPARRIDASNMCPTIVTREQRALLALGASGGNHIVPAVAQVTALMLDFDLSLEQAMNHARLDASDRGSVRCDPALGEAVLSHLAERHTLEIAQRLTFPKLYASPSAVAVHGSGYVGLNDPSQPIGGASGPQPMPAPAPAAHDDPGTTAVRA